MSVDARIKKIKLDLLFQKINQLLAEKEQVICAIDGGAASGKSTLAKKLQEKYDCNLITMDDFFLQPSQRTPERLAEVGGNIDYERFFNQILQPLQSRQKFTYQPYDCIIEQMTRPIIVEPKALTVIEGVYSQRPQFIPFYDLKIFLKISENKQKERLIKRNEKLYPRFEKEWLPMEHLYFTKFKVESNCDLILTTERKKLK